MAQASATLQTEADRKPPVTRQAEKKPEYVKVAFASLVGTSIEWYDYFLYGTAAALFFPKLFFPKFDPLVGTLLAFGTYTVGFIARPIAGVVFGHFGDRIGRKQMLYITLLFMGIASTLIGLLPTYASMGLLATALLVLLRLIQGFAVAGEISGASSMILEHAPFGRRGYFASFTLQGVQAGQILAAAVFLPLSYALSKEAFMSWGWRVPFLLSVFVLIAGYVIRREVDETPAFAEERGRREIPKAPVIDALTNHWDDMLRVVCMALMNVIPVVATIFGAAYAVQPGYGVGMDKSVYLWIPVVGNVVAVVVIPFVGDLSDRIGRRLPIIVGSLAAGLLSFAYLYAISIKSVPLAFVFSILMWGVVYQGYNAVFPSFYPELFPTRARVSGMAIAQNVGTMLTALLPALFAAIAPPGSQNVPMMIGACAFGVTVISAIAAFSARETHRVHLNDLGERDAVAIDKMEYDRLRQAASA